MDKRSQGEIVKVSGPLVIAKGMRDADMFDVVEVSDKKLIGEIIEMHGDEASIQVYEETAGLGPGEAVVSRGTPLSVELGPGLIGEIFDGIQRPLDVLVETEGDHITRGAFAPALNRDKVWEFQAVKAAGDKVVAGDVIGLVQETEIMEHRIMIPPGKSGVLSSI
ncbi:MAG TPA: V-type ATP synthase subunit A, partial [Clostridiaceae bacterium]|nr:V-type ATP synthase subunit A [Clostridiaceae bacterium]